MKKVFLSFGISIIGFFGVFSSVAYEEDLRNTSNEVSRFNRQIFFNTNPSRFTPLQVWRFHKAAKNGDIDKVIWFLDQGIDPNIPNRDGLMPLHSAVWNKANTRIVNLLLDRGADINAIDQDGWTALHFAAFYGQSSITGLLLERGATPNIRNDLGRTALHYAPKGIIEQIRGYRDEELQTAKQLLDGGVDPTIRDNDGLTVFHTAAEHGDTDMIRWWLFSLSQVHINAVDNEGWTVLHYAAFYGHIPIAQLLLNHRIVHNIRNNDGKTALHLVMENVFTSANRKTAMANLLLDKGLDPTIHDNDGLTVLDYAKEKHITEIMDRLGDEDSFWDRLGIDL